jgi:transposase-like protein
VNPDGEHDVLGMWSQKTVGAKFWLEVLTDLTTRGVQDVLLSQPSESTSATASPTVQPDPTP